MVAEVLLPSSLSELVDNIGSEKNSGNVFYLETIYDIKEMDPDEVSQHIQGLVAEDLVDSLSQHHTDMLVALITSLSDLSDESKTDLLQLFIVTLSSCIDTMSVDCPTKVKNNYKILFYLFIQLCIKSEAIFVETSKSLDTSSKPKTKASTHAASSAFDWLAHRISCLQTIRRASSLPPSHLWTANCAHDHFSSPTWQFLLHLLDTRPLGMMANTTADSSARKTCADSLALLSSQLSAAGTVALASALVDSLCRYEHMTTAAADICSRSTGALFSALFNELSHIQISDKSANSTASTTATEASPTEDEDEPGTQSSSSAVAAAAVKGSSGKGSSSSAKHVGLFLSKIAEMSPKMTSIYFAIVLPQLGSDSFQIRSAVITCLGEIIKYLHLSLEKKHTTRSAEDDPVSAPPASSALDEDEVNAAQVVRMKEQMLDMLSERHRDLSTFTRAVVLKTWAALAEANAVAPARIISVLDIAMDRLMDKTATVRRASLQLIVALLDANPFAATLDAELFKAGILKYAEAKNHRLALLREKHDGKLDEEDMGKSSELLDEEFACSGAVREDEELAGIDAELTRLNIAVVFATKLAGVVTSIESFLKSKTTSDLVESIRFLTHAINFSLPKSAKCFQSIMSLVWHPEQVIRDEFISAFNSVFLTDGAAVNPLPLPAQEIASNLQNLYARCVVEDIISLERLIGECYKRRCISDEVISLCWDTVFTGSNEHTTSALQVIAMVASIEPQVITFTKIDRLVKTVLQKSICDANLATITAVLQCLNASPSEDVKTISEYISPLIRQLLVGDYLSDSETHTRSWFALCEGALTLLFTIHDTPDHFVSSVLIEIYGKVTNDANSNAGKCSANLLSRFCFLFGQFSLSLLIYAEKLAFETKKVMDGRLKDTADHETDVDAMEEEMGMAAAADADHERVFGLLTEKYLLGNNALCGKFLPVVAFIAANDKNVFNGSILRESSVLALCRCMAISSEVCILHLPLLFTILKRENMESIKTTIIVALGDLAFRFPNAVEPWTPYIYDRLCDSSLLVRYNTLMVLTHLILNNMIKVKGQVCHVVLCLIDPSPEVAGLAKVFFEQLSKLSHNPIYNLLGDIIAILSRDEAASNAATEEIKVRVIENADFETVMCFLLSFINSDKQGDGLADRLVSRLALAESVSMRRKLAFCVSQLSISEKAVRKFVESIKLIKDSLYDKEVFNFFRIALKNAKKVSSKAASGGDGESQSASDEFDNILNVIQKSAEGVANGDEEIDVDDLIEQTKTLSISASSNAKSNKRPKKTPAKKPAPKRSKKSSGSVDFDSEEETENVSRKTTSATPKGKNKTPARSARKAPLRTINYAEDEDDIE